MSELNPYSIKPVESGYTWPTTPNRKIRVENKVAGEASELNWQGQDGPYLLEDIPGIERGLETASEALLGKSVAEVVAESKNTWKPYIANGNGDANRIILSGATDKINARNVEIGYLKKTGNLIGINAAIESRELALAKPGDIAFGNSEAWQQVAAHKQGVDTHTLGRGFLNYNSHRWLYKALESAGTYEPEDRELQIIINHLAIDPEKVLQVYATDEETEVLFNYLKAEANKVRNQIGLPNIDKLNVDANSVEITKKLLNKGYLYPTPSDASGIDDTNMDYETLLKAEGKLSGIEREMNQEIPRMPGYNIEWMSDYDKFHTQTKLAIKLMKQRWGSDVNFVKQAEGSDGEGAFRIDTDKADYDEDETIKKMYNEGHAWVIEPFVSYKKLDLVVDGEHQMRNLAPSIHVRGGKAYDTKLVQVFVTERDENGKLKETTEWGGHIFAPKSYVDQVLAQGGEVLGMNATEYYEGIDSIKNIADNFASQGFSRGGIDMALGTIQTKWGEKKINALQDMNIRTNGGDTARGFGKLVEIERGREMPFSTIVIKPNMGVDYETVDRAINDAAQDLNIDRNDLKLICAVAPGWGMFGSVSDTPEQAFDNAIRVQDYLKAKGILR